MPTTAFSGAASKPKAIAQTTLALNSATKNWEIGPAAHGIGEQIEFAIFSKFKF